MKTGECQVIPACYGDRGLARHLRKREPAARMRGLWCRACLFRTTTWSEEGVQLQRPVHIGLAVSLGEEGLIVPVLRDAEQKSLRRLATEVGDLARRARARQLAPDEVRGGTFTITNHGVSGSLFATPITSQPQSAILGVGAIQKRVVVVGDAIAIRPMVYLSLTFDHRLLDGASADAFLATIVATLEKDAF
jgi:pyruvate/2-oxoglutarate dehydrogenase complex dihydrolipoamide acyltransferase (E2) component